jgi:glutamate-1-semialdehyde 2,1-aminomutase
VTTTTHETIADRYVAAFPKSRQRFEEAKAIFPNGVTHDLRFLEPFPVYIERAAGSRKWSIDGQELIDYWSGHGALLLGHSPPEVVEAVTKQIGRGTHLGGCHELEIEWGRQVQHLVPSAERVRFTGSGTEATLMAVRLARLHTDRPKLLKLIGHFHGWHDSVLPGAYSPYTPGLPPGIPKEVGDQTVTIPPNDLTLVERTLASDPEIAAIILEPTGGHWGAVPIRGEFLRGLRELANRFGQVLIFDEVITGFRVHPGGAQAHYGVQPDMTTLAKILAGGLPGGALAGRVDLMEQIAFRPGRPKVRHPGTFNANPLSAVAGIATLSRVATGQPCNAATTSARLLRRKLNTLFEKRGWPWIAYGDFSFVHLKPGYSGPRSLDDAFIPCNGELEQLDGPKDPKLVRAFRQGLLLNGVDWPGLGAWLTAVHTERDLERTVSAIEATIREMMGEGLA